MKRVLLLCWGQLQLLHRGVIYQAAVSFTNPRVSITDPREKIQMVKTDPKKVPSQKKNFARLSKYKRLKFSTSQYL